MNRRSITFGRLTLAALLLGIVAVTSVAGVPARGAVAPEWITAVNVTLALASLTLAAVVAHWFWLWIRWWSLPISLALTVVAVAIASVPIGDLLDRMQSPPEEGFLYSSGFTCGIYVDGVFRNARTNDRIYVLQQSCVPDGPEERWIYRRHGGSPLMEQLSPRQQAEWTESPNTLVHPHPPAAK